MAARTRVTRPDEDRHHALSERLRYLAFKAKQNPKSLSLNEIDELCRIVVVLAPQKDADG